MRPGRRWLPLLVALLVPLLAAGPSHAASGAPAAPAQGPDRLQVVGQSGFVPSEGVFEVALAWSGPLAGHHLEVRVFQLVAEEAELEERTPTGQLNRLPAIPLDALPRDAAGHLVLRIPVRSVPLPVGDAERMFLPDPGVYPVELEVVGPTDDVVASLFTDLIRLPTSLDDDELVPVAVVVRIGRHGLPLAGAVALLERFPDVTLTVMVDPAAVGEEADPALVARLRAALTSRHTLAVDQIPLDVSALAEIGHLELYDRLRRSGAEQVAAQLGRPVATDVAPVDRPPTAAAAAHLAAEVAVLLGPVGAEEGILGTSRGELPLVSPDEDLMEVLGSSSRDPHHVLARLAIRFREGETTPVLLASDPRLGVTAADLAVVLSGLRAPSLLEALPLAAAAERADGALEPSERPRQDLRATADLLESTLVELADYAAFHVTGVLSPQLLEERILAALAVDVAPPQRRERLSAVRRDLQEAFDVIALPEGRTVNLAATTSHLPLAVTSRASGVRRVRITFASDKLTFPEEDGGSRVVDLEPGTSSLDFMVESRSIGVSPLDVIVATPDGSRELARTRITIRSTAVPGLGLLLSGAALVFLVVWWVLNRTRRRSTVPQVPGAEPVA